MTSIFLDNELVLKLSTTSFFLACLMAEKIPNTMKQDGIIRLRENSSVHKNASVQNPEKVKLTK